MYTIQGARVTQWHFGATAQPFFQDLLGTSGFSVGQLLAGQALENVKFGKGHPNLIDRDSVIVVLFHAFAPVTAFL